MRKEVEDKITNAFEDQVDLGELGIRDNELDEIISAVISQRPNITELYLNNNHITDIGAPILKRLSSLPMLKVLDLQFNSIDQVGALDIFTLQSTKPELNIAFHGNKITNTGVMEDIVDQAKKVKRK